MQMISRYLIAVVIALFTLQASAQVHQARGQYTGNYKELLGTFSRKQAPTEFKQKARQEASLKAIEAYFAEAGQSESANFDAIRAEVLADPGRYILDTTVLSEMDEPNDYQYTVAVRVSLNVANLRNATQANSAVGRAAESEKSALSFVFVSRQIASIKTYDDRVYKRRDRMAEAEGSMRQRESYDERSSEGESVKGSRIDTHGSQSQETSRQASLSMRESVAVETGGSTTRRAAESTWQLLPSANLNQVFISQFSQAGYDVIEGAMVESDKFKIADIENDYKSGNDLQAKTLRSIAAGMREAQIPLIALGTLDVGLAEKDPQTGLLRVAVTVNAKIWDVTKAIPRTRVAVGPVAYSGVGPTEEEARGAALQAASSSAAQELSSRMATMGMQ